MRQFGPIRHIVQIAQKTVKYSPANKLYDAFITILAGAHGLVEVNTRLRADLALQRAFGRSGCAEQSVVRAGKIVSIRIGRAIRINVASLMAWAERELQP